jgi:hypothetical protein
VKGRKAVVPKVVKLVQLTMVYSAQEWSTKGPPFYGAITRTWVTLCIAYAGLLFLYSVVREGNLGEDRGRRGNKYEFSWI